MPDEELTLILRLRDEATAQMKKAQTGIGGSVKKIAKVAAAAALVIGAAVAAAGVKLFKLASDAEEADNVIGLAFGSMKQQAIDWSVTFAACYRVIQVRVARAGRRPRVDHPRHGVHRGSHARHVHTDGRARCGHVERSEERSAG